MSTIATLDRISKMYAFGRPACRFHSATRSRNGASKRNGDGAKLNRLSRKVDGLLELVGQSSAGFLTLDAAARFTGLSVESIRKLLSEKKLVALRPVRGRVVVDRAELVNYVRSANTQPRTGRGRRHA